MEQTRGRKLTIYMINGTPTGPKTIEIGNWSGKAVYTPRANLKSMLNRPEFEHPGVYLLRNESNISGYDEQVYIGEAEQLKARLLQHIAGKDFESAICFISKDELLTKAHIKYLESRLVALAKDANSSQVENVKSPSLPRLSEADISDMEYYIDQIRLILPAVGMNTLVPSAPHSKDKEGPAPIGDIYFIKAENIKAEMIEAEGAFIVKQGSEARVKTTDSIAPGWLKIRNKLINDGALNLIGDKYVFTDDASFSSPSAASSVILGRQAPGPISWVTKQGKTYKEIQESMTSAETTDEQVIDSP